LALGIYSTARRERMMTVLQQSMIKAFNGRSWLAVALLLGLVTAANAAYLFQANQRVEVEDFLTPESVAVGPDGRYYVSNLGLFNVTRGGNFELSSTEVFI